MQRRVHVLVGEVEVLRVAVVELVHFGELQQRFLISLLVEFLLESVSLLSLDLEILQTFFHLFLGNALEIVDFVDVTLEVVDVLLQSLVHVLHSLELDLIVF